MPSTWPWWCRQSFGTGWDCVGLSFFARTTMKNWGSHPHQGFKSHMQKFHDFIYGMKRWLLSWFKMWTESYGCLGAPQPETDYMLWHPVSCLIEHAHAIVMLVRFLAAHCEFMSLNSGATWMCWRRRWHPRTNVGFAKTKPWRNMKWFAKPLVRMAEPKWTSVPTYSTIFVNTKCVLGFNDSEFMPHFTMFPVIHLCCILYIMYIYYIYMITNNI